MKVQELVEYWQSHSCVFCDTKNWTYHSHSQRYYTGTFLNTDACKCRSCGKEYWLAEDGERQPTVQGGREHPCPLNSAHAGNSFDA
ncbi:hypothetical protein [Stieleria sp.]|uniref:hypothetical protein n=1 Tax=Stieleria sp. TaxID=2795976 RepID=UPI0035650A12